MSQFANIYLFHHLLSIRLPQKSESGVVYFAEYLFTSTGHRDWLPNQDKGLLNICL